MTQPQTHQPSIPRPPQDFVTPEERLRPHNDLPPRWFAWGILILILGLVLGLSISTALCP